VNLGLWSPHENLSLRRNQIPVHFPPKVLELAHQRLNSPPPDLHVDRLDLTHLKVYTIDDESTREIDDGLSLEYLADGSQRLWIHIADPSRWLIPGDELDLEARRRTTTLYLPTGMIPMFPSELATGPMSLIQGQICCALSFGIILDPTGAIQDYSINTSLIKSTYRLTYEDVDEMLELGVQAESELEAIAQWAKRRQVWRHSQGAISIHMPESSIKVSDDEITIEVLHDSLARQLVAEMMILTGEVAARYGQAQNLPLPFRSQPQPELPSEEELLQLPAGPVRSCAIRRCMPRSEMSTTPARHASLGLDTYAQVTSPIRRYSDLLAHFQIKAHLRGEPLPFSIEEMKELTMSISSAAYEATLVERQTNKYWALEFLRRNTDEIWHALMLRWLREHESLGLVLLEDLGIELPMRFTRPISPGDRLELKVNHADPRHEIVHFQEMVYQEN
jgi:exoribonuclease-2